MIMYMRNIWIIAKKEIKQFFVSFVAYIILFFFLLLGGYYFYSYIINIRDGMVIMPYFLKFLGFISFICTPFITMRVFSEEKKMGTIELLITSPLKEIEIVLGKFLGTLLFYLIYLSFSLFYLLIIIAFSRPDYGVVLAGYLGFILLESAYISIGILISAMTKNQIVSGVVTLIFLLFFWIVSWIASSLPNIAGEILGYFSFLNHYEEFTKGIIDTKHIIFYISIIFINLFLTVRLLENRKIVI